MAALHGQDSRRGRTGAGGCVGERVAIGIVEEGREVYGDRLPARHSLGRVRAHGYRFPVRHRHRDGLPSR